MICLALQTMYIQIRWFLNKVSDWNLQICARKLTLPCFVSLQQLGSVWSQDLGLKFHRKAEKARFRHIISALHGGVNYNSIGAYRYSELLVCCYGDAYTFLSKNAFALIAPLLLSRRGYVHSKANRKSQKWSPLVKMAIGLPRLSSPPNSQECCIVVWFNRNP